MENWLDNLKVGDNVIVDDETRVVEKITPTRQIKVRGIERRFINGCLKGAMKWDSYRYLREWTQGAEDAIARRARRSTILTRLHDVNFDILDDSELEEINTMVLAYVAKNNNVRKGMIVTYTGKERHYQTEQKEGCEVISHPYIKGKSIFVQLDKIISGVNVKTLIIENSAGN